MVMTMSALKYQARISHAAVNLYLMPGLPHGNRIRNEVVNNAFQPLDLKDLKTYYTFP